MTKQEAIATKVSKICRDLVAEHGMGLADLAATAQMAIILQDHCMTRPHDAELQIALKSVSRIAKALMLMAIEEAK